MVFYRQHELCLQLRDTQNSEYLGELYLDVTLTPQTREEREQVTYKYFYFTFMAQLKCITKCIHFTIAQYLRRVS